MIRAAQISNATGLSSVSLRQSFLRKESLPVQCKPGHNTSVPVRCVKHDQSIFQYPAPSNRRENFPTSIKHRAAAGALQDLNTRRRHGSWRKVGSNVAIRSFRKGLDGDSDGWDPSLELGVPEDQRPVNELAALQDSALYSWAQLQPKEFGARILGLWTALFVFLGGPIAAASFEPTKMPVEFALAGGAGAVFGTAILLLRLYLGWSYVGDRLLSAVVPYEETGWYDGQLWVKPPEVKPVMVRLKQTLLGSASLLAASTLALVLILPPSADEAVVYVQRRNPSGEAMASEQRVGFRVRDLTNPPLEVLDDDDVAAAAAAAANGRPVYCQDRYYRALAGGQYCKWSDLKR